MLENGIIIACIVLFIHACSWEWMIGGFIRRYIPETLFISKPIYSCPVCMSPWWGTLLYLMFFNNGYSLKEWIGTIGVAAGISVFYIILTFIHQSIDEIREHLNNEADGK